MKKIVILLFSLLLLLACGKKEYENLSKRDVALMLYQGEILGDVNTKNMIYQLENYLISKSETDAKASEQLDLWRSLREHFARAHRNYRSQNRNWWLQEKEQYPSLGEVFGKEKEGISGDYRLYLGANEEGENVAKDILTDAPFTGIAVFRTKSGKIEQVVSYEEGVQKEVLIESTFYDNNIDVYSMQYFKDGQLYKERFYQPNGEFKAEEYVN